MKKVWEVIKKIFIWLGAVFVAIFTVLFIKEREVVSTGSTTEGDSDEINRKAAAKREEAIERISNTDARTLCDSYGSVCDTITDGKERFRRRCKRADQMEAAKLNVELENQKLKKELSKKNNQFFYGALIGGTGGVIVTSLVFGLVMGFCK